MCEYCEKEKPILYDNIFDTLNIFIRNGLLWEKTYDMGTEINYCPMCGRKLGEIKMDFGEAIKLLKKGKKLQREGWNGKNQYIELAWCISYKNASGEVINAEHCAIGNKAIAFVGTSGVQLGWLASQADMLAKDWKIVE